MTRRTGERLTVKHLKEILRLRLQGHGHRTIAKSCQVGRTTIQDFLHRVQSAGVTVSEALALSDDELKFLLGSRAKRYTSWSDEQGFFQHVSRELRKKSVTLSVLWEEYRDANPDGYSYSMFCARYAEWKKAQRVWMHQEHRAGDKAFVDYCGDTIDIIDSETGEVIKASVFVAVLGATNYTYAEATWRQDIESWIGAHVRAVEYFGGVPSAFVPDNAKSLVTKAVWYDPQLSLSYSEFAEHYGCAILPARVRKPRDKAKVEVGVQIVQRWILARLRRNQFFSLAQANSCIRELLEKLNTKTMRGYGKSRCELFEELERSALKPLPSLCYTFGLWKHARVGFNYHVEYDKNHYSAPFQLCREQMSVKVTEHTVELFHKGGRIVTHRREFGKNRYVTLKEHMPPNHQRVSEWDLPRLLSWAAAVGPQTSLQAQSIVNGRSHPEHGMRPVMGLLSLSRKYGNNRLEAACARANSLAITSMTAVSNMLKSGRDQLQEEPPSASPSSHANIRGGDYYH